MELSYLQEAAFFGARGFRGPGFRDTEATYRPRRMGRSASRLDQ